MQHLLLSLVCTFYLIPYCVLHLYSLRMSILRVSLEALLISCCQEVAGSYIAYIAAIQFSYNYGLRETGEMFKFSDGLLGCGLDLLHLVNTYIFIPCSKPHNKFLLSYSGCGEFSVFQDGIYSALYLVLHHCITPLALPPSPQWLCPPTYLSFYTSVYIHLVFINPLCTHMQRGLQ